MEQQTAGNPYAAPKARLDDVPEAATVPLWNPEAGGAWSLLLSVMFGSWIMMQNWTALGETARASTSRIWLIVSVILFVLMLSIPGFSLLGLPYLIVWYFMENRPQIRYVRDRFDKDYPRRPWLKVLLLTLMFEILAGFVVGFIAAFALRR